MNTVKLLILLFAFLVSRNVQSQDTTGISQVSSKYFDAVSKKANSINDQLDKKSQKALVKFQKEEQKLKTKLARIDSLSANNIFSNAEDKYKQLQEKIKGNKALSRYIPHIDTTITSLKFLEQNPQLLKNVNESKEKLTHAVSKVKELEAQIQKAEDIKQFLKERRQYLKEQVEKLGFAKQLKKLNKDVYYFAATVQDYKEIIKDSKKAERKGIELLSKTKAFQNFMKKNSILASLFRMPVEDPNDPTYLASLAGLQTRAQLTSLIQNQIAAGGANGQQTIQQNLQQAQSQLQQLKDRVNKWGSGSSDDIIPEGFKPNNQKTKNFWQRLEFGSNFQTQGVRFFYPITTDFGLSLGFKANDKSIIGIGASYKMGWGTGWNNIRITHQGIGLRTYADIKLKESFWISGGYEQNYKSEIRNIDQLREHSAWVASGLIGISKVVSVRSKIFKKTKVQLLWDFLSYNQVPKAQPILFRLGYQF